MLQPVENLLERELNAGENVSMATSDLVRARCSASERNKRGASCDKEGKMRNHQRESHQSAKYCSGTGGQATQSNASRSTWMDVGVEPHNHASRVHREDSRRDLSCVYQIVGAPADVDGSLQLAEQSTLGLPGDPVCKASLHLETFLARHPGVNRAKHVARSPGDGSRRGSEPGARELGDESALLGDIYPRSLFRERLIERLGAEADFLPYVAKLGLA